ncbi:MAG: pirin family protein [Candidatus Bathyarchaeia archaeon]|jgi:redox-sensitive bicupin YhaK (pirin superfamily)
MAGFRRIDRILKGKSTLEGAGVKLKRAFGPHEVPLLDPFLLLDDFHSNNPDDYLAGFPWHPHRGIETVTYVLEGMVEHGDSMGNRGVIRSGDVQWMTAGNGIIHQEMPKGSEGGLMWGFQLWVNLPASHKMDDPTYRGITRGEIPEVEVNPGVRVKVICGELKGNRGPVQGLTVDCEYLDVMLEPNAQLEHSTKKGHGAFAYVIGGRGYFDQQRSNPIDAEQVVVFSGGEKVKISTGDNSLRCLMISGKPVGEPVAWLGPIVMNTQEELRTAFSELDRGTFLRNPKAARNPPELHPTYYKR